MNELLAQPSTDTPAETPKTLTKTALFLFCFGFAPFLWLFFVNLWGRPHYQFFPLVLGGTAFLAWIRTSEVARPFRPGSWRAVTGLWITSLALLASGTFFWSPWLGSLAAFLAGISLVWTVGGWPLVRANVPAFVLVATIIPPPLALDTRLAEWLRMVAVNWSSHLLDLVGVIHARSGNVIELPGAKLLVEEACSGINSVLITMACCLFYMLWQKRSVFRILFGIAASVSFVLLGNVFRITFGAWLKARHNVDILSGWKHETFGILLFASYMILIVSLDQWLLFLLSPWRRRAAKSPARTAEPALGSDFESTVVSRHVPRFAVISVACAFALLGSLDLALALTHYRQTGGKFPLAKDTLRAEAKFVLPDRLGGWTRLSAEVPMLHKIETLGVKSHVWHFQKGDLLASIALDYPFNGYHDVTVCYTLAGWKVSPSQAHWGPEAGTGIASARVQMQEDTGMFGNLWFSTVDEQGHWLETPVLKRALGDRWRMPGKIEPTTYRVQALAATYTPLQPAEDKAVQDLFQQARTILWRQLSTQLGHK